MGGPIKKPKKLIVDTAAIAAPGFMVVDFPAALYTIGTTDDMPAPTNINPIIAGTRVGNTTTASRPAVLKNPLTCKVVLSPNLCENQSATKRPAAIKHIPAV